MSDVYTDLGSVPLDIYSVADVGDYEPDADGFSLHPQSSASLRVPLNAGTVSPPYVIPYTHAIQLGSQGKDVVGAKRAIWSANGLAVPVSATQTFGPVAVKQLRQFQRKHGLAADGVLGQATLKKLAPHFDAYAYLLYVGYPPGSSVRERIVAYALWGYNNRGAIGYAQYRPMAFMGDLQRIPINEDCSTFVTKAYKYAGAPDPNCRHYDGYGNTGSERGCGVWLALENALPGDLAHYDGPQHVAIYVGQHRVISLGSSIGPLLLDVLYRQLTEIRRYV